MKKIDSIYIKTFELQPGKGDRKRLEIIECSVECISKFGIDGAVFDRIAEKLGTRRSHIKYYFKDREQLLLSAVKYSVMTAQEITIALIDSYQKPESKVLGVVEAAFVWSRKFPDQARVLLLFYYQCAKFEVYKKLQNQIREAGVKRIEALIKTCDNAKLRKNSQEIAIKIQAITTGILLDSLTGVKTRGQDPLKLTLELCSKIME